MRVRSACVGLACAAGLAATASGTTLSLNVYENADNADLTGLSLWVDITAGVGDTVDFRFRNESVAPNATASIVNIYFEKSRGTSLIENGTRGATVGSVNFVDEGNPQNPAPGSLNWNDTSQWFSAETPQPPPPPIGGLAGAGIGKDESLTITFDLIGGATVSNVVSAIISGDFRIAQHVIALGDGGSVWTVTDSVIIPLPGAAGLGALGLGLVAVRRRR